MFRASGFGDGFVLAVGVEGSEEVSAIHFPGSEIQIQCSRFRVHGAGGMFRSERFVLAVGVEGSEEVRRPPP